MLKKLVGFIVLGLCLVGVACNKPASNDLLKDIQQKKVLTVGVKFDAPPFGVLDSDGYVKGFEIDLAKALAKKLLGNEKAIQLVQVNTATRIAALNSKQVDLIIATMTITPERQKVVTFSQPYYHAQQGIMVKADSAFNALPAVAEQPIAYVIGGTTESNLKKAFPKAQLIGFKSHSEAFSAFNAGRTAAFCADDVILYGYYHAHCGVKILPGRISKEPYGIAFRKDAASQSLNKAVQTWLEETPQQALLKQLNQRWNQNTPPAQCEKR